jgi:hypothetical protein
MKRKLAEVCRSEFQPNVWNGLWGAWEVPFMAFSWRKSFPYGIGTKLVRRFMGNI